MTGCMQSLIQIPWRTVSQKMRFRRGFCASLKYLQVTGTGRVLGGLAKSRYLARTHRRKVPRRAARVCSSEPFPSRLGAPSAHPHLPPRNSPEKGSSEEGCRRRAWNAALPF